jgi:hypothetical protein
MLEPSVVRIAVKADKTDKVPKKWEASMLTVG